MQTEKKHQWVREDFLIALYVYLTLKKKNILIHKQEAFPFFEDALNLINSLPIHVDNHPLSMGSLNIRTCAFADWDSEYPTGGPRKALPKGGLACWNEFAHRYEELKIEIESIHAIAPQLERIFEDTNFFEPVEGQLKGQYHFYHERDPKIVKQKKAKFKKEHGRLYCEACGFDFKSQYGEHGDGFIECHHIKPVSELDGTEKTRLDDLKLLCANCHRMVHYRQHWLTFEDLIRHIQKVAL